MLPLVQADASSSSERDSKVLNVSDQNGKPFSAFNLLDPPPGNNEQVFVAMHISYGQYHAGVVCNDISTNYEFERLPVLQQDILEKFKEFLLRRWKHLEEQENQEEIKAIQQQYHQKQVEFLQVSS